MVKWWGASQGVPQGSILALLLFYLSTSLSLVLYNSRITITPSDTAHNPGVVLDNQLCLSAFVSNLKQFSHLQQRESLTFLVYRFIANKAY